MERDEAADLTDQRQTLTKIIQNIQHNDKRKWHKEHFVIF